MSPLSARSMPETVKSFEFCVSLFPKHTVLWGITVRVLVASLVLDGEYHFDYFVFDVLKGAKCSSVLGLALILQ